ncbi:hypothetical protein IHE44_0005077 [Lamprotornis superbus]|uniref:Uncharacterized protein n=1 Tax=Lamprotornis superbus TaxID=245042 RepID=A0A835TZC7_9PASS|nr:hypothetical protein IHE44_0005077 [Lamprotornis superbus]
MLKPDVRVPYHGGAQQYADAYQEREDANEDSEMEEDAERDSEWDAEMEEDSESEGEIEYDLSNMEITEELRQFFAETERHREELRKAVKAAAAAVEKSRYGGRQQQLEAEDPYVEADQDLHRRVERSVEPPTERPGERRMAEMKKLVCEGSLLCDTVIFTSNTSR